MGRDKAEEELVCLAASQGGAISCGGCACVPGQAYSRA
jgi:hypothetical protein